MKFAIPPLIHGPDGVSVSGSNALWLLPAQSLDRFKGVMANGDWRLEIRDLVPGATEVPSPALIQWELRFDFEDSEPAPVPVTHAMVVTGELRPEQLQRFVIDVPPWAKRSTNAVSSTSPTELWFNQVTPPTGTNVADILLAGGSAVTNVVLVREGTPPLKPGKYFVSVRNTNTTPIEFSFRVDFDVLEIVPGLQQTVSLPSGPSPVYFQADISPNADSISIRLRDLTGNLDLLASKGLPFPTKAASDYASLLSGTDPEEIIVDEFSSPVPLAPGAWYFAVLNADEMPAEGI